jgi:hypothetical protein
MREDSGVFYAKPFASLSDYFIWLLVLCFYKSFEISKLKIEYYCKFEVSKSILEIKKKVFKTILKIENRIVFLFSI